MNKKYCFFIIVGGLILLMALPVSGQVVYGQQASCNPQFVYSHWTLEDNTGAEITISQAYIPLVGFLPIQDNFEARFYIANTSNSLEYDGFDNTLSGVSDVRVQLNHSFYEDQIILSGGVNLPLGKKKLSLTEEWVIIEYLSQDFLNFPIRQFGQGFGFNMLVGGATMLGEIRVGGGVMYQYNGEYEPYEASGDYKPGDVFNANVGGDYQKDKWLFSANLVFTAYTADKLDDQKTFKQSKYFDMSLATVYKEEKYSLSGSANYRIRDRNTFYDSTETVFSQLKLYGNEFAAETELSWNFANNWYTAPSLSLKLIADNESGLGSSSLFGFGTTLGNKLSKHVKAELAFKYFTGNADESDFDLNGYQVGLNLMATL